VCAPLSVPALLAVPVLGDWLSSVVSLADSVGSVDPDPDASAVSLVSLDVFSGVVGSAVVDVVGVLWSPAVVVDRSVPDFLDSFSLRVPVPRQPPTPAPRPIPATLRSRRRRVGRSVAISIRDS
jgi:hypothetical protein